MENRKAHFLTFKLLISLVICFPVIQGKPAEGIQENKRSAANTLNGGRIVINEIMADPTPLIGLPDAEWIELFNNSDVPVRLKDWRIVVGITGRVLPDSTVPARQFAILCSSRVADALQKFGKTVALASLPALRNSGNTLTLKDPYDSTVDSICYSDSWYGNPFKKEGGWSLERIDPERDCGQALNWKASESPSGGTPGYQNSILSDNSDLVSPRIISASVINPNTAEISFSEWMDPLTISSKLNYKLSDGMGNPDSLSLADEKIVRLIWNMPFKENQTYLMSTVDLTDLCGNKLSPDALQICRIVLKSGEILISEVLFNPWPEGSDFVELFNHSTREIPVGKLVLAGRDDSGKLKNLSTYSQIGTLMTPGSYLALTSDSSGILMFYKTECPECILQVSKLPALNNDEGTVVILSDSMVVLDEFTYSEEMHHPLIIDQEGVSLERSSFEKAANAVENWHSASTDAGFATPGYKNSQLFSPQVKKTVISLRQAFISPDNDGFNDELEMDYTLPSPGWIINCRIFDTTGRFMLHWLNNVILGTSGELIWNGRDAGNRILPPGPYILSIELFDLSGKIQRFRKALVITARNG